MIVTVRVYRQHDMDLMTLAFDKSFHLGREMKRALVAVANKESYNGTTSDYLGTDTSGYVPKSIREQISLNPADPREKEQLIFSRRSSTDTDALLLRHCSANPFFLRRLWDTRHLPTLQCDTMRSHQWKQRQWSLLWNLRNQWLRNR